MIARKNRFHGHHSVSKVRGKTISGTDISIRFAKNNRKDFRLAVVISKKVCNLAVRRNRVRRRVYELVRKSKILNDHPIDVIIYVKKSSLVSIPHSELEQIVLPQLKKLISK